MNKLDQAIEENNATDIRNMLKAYITSDPTDSRGTIKKALQQTYDNKIDVWEEHDGKEFPSTPWTEEKFLDLQVDLRMNFSEERFRYLLKVGEEVYRLEAKTISQPSSPPKNESSQNNQPKKSQAMKWGIMAITAGILIILLMKLVNSNN